MFYIERLSALVIFAIVSIILILAITGLFAFAAANTILTPFKKRPVNEAGQEVKLSTELRKAYADYIAKKQQPVEQEV
ncbi:cytochrome b [Aeromonas hydrophila]|uniref:hypothetical protein n=1 Tax=Aeromonas hydrophila TaxID=644 RepID=UPI002167C165|nr:hypothetical protein [Aeromonas hydrophila]MCS3766158.1 cytochrome b [Aeromonas hydrophila]